MTILPNSSKKKPQTTNNNDIDSGEQSTSVNHHTNHSPHQLANINALSNHLSQSAESGSCGSFYLASQSPPPCWSPTAGNLNLREEKLATSHSSPVHYEESRDGGPSHAKRRYRASPLRSVRPKLREHRGGASPSYPSTSDYWNVNSVNQHNISLAHKHSLPPNTISNRAPHSPEAGPSCSHSGEISDDDPSAYNSGDEYEAFGGWNLTKEQWEEKERWFEKKMKKSRRSIRKMREDGACLFRAISDQVFGDQEMHSVVRQQCMDYIQRNEETFAPFVSECFQTYVRRKRKDDCYGNHIEIAAMSELYNRVIEVYCYSADPINIFQGSMQTDNAPIRLTYHRGTHYNSLVDPYAATIGVGLGLPGLQPGLADKNLMVEATNQSENIHIEKTMLEDKIRATDFEATSDVIEEQIAHQSYLDWVRDIENNQNRSQGTTGGNPVTGGDCSPKGTPKERRSPPLRPASVSSGVTGCDDGAATSRSSPRLLHSSSPKVRSSPSRASVSAKPYLGSATSSGKPAKPYLGPATSSVVDLAVPGSSKDPVPRRSSSYGDFYVDENASYLNLFASSDLYGGLSDFSNAEEADILARVLAQSQQEYFESLKNRKDDAGSTADATSASVSASASVSPSRDG